MNNRPRSVGKLAMLGAACAFSACIATSSQVRADDTTNALLDLLKAKGAISQAEYDQIKARQQAEAKGSAQKLQAAEAKAREAEARAREAEAKAKAATAAAQTAKPQSNADTAVQANAQSQAGTNAAAQAGGQSQKDLAVTEAQTRALALSAADMPVPSKMPSKSPVQYVTVLPNCVGIRVGEVDICTKGDLDFFAVEQFPDKSANPATVSGGLATVDKTDSNSVRGGLLPSSFQVSLSTHQMGMDLGVYVGLYSGGNNSVWSTFGANSGGSPVSLGTPGIDFRQFFGTISTPTFGTVKVGRDIGIFASDAILNDLTLLGVGTPAGNFAPGDTSLGRIGIGYLYTDFIPQITYKSPTVNGFTVTAGAFTPYDETNKFSGDPISGNMTGHDLPELQGQVKYVGTIAANAKLTLSADALWQKQVADCPTGSTCAFMTPEQQVDAWAVDGFGMLDVGGFNFVAYGYTGKGVGTTGMFFDGVDVFGDPRKSYGGYLQAAYALTDAFMVGGSYGVSYLNTANAADAANDQMECFTPPTNTAASCLVHKNESWIGFARYTLTKWVKLQAEYIHTTDENNFGQSNHDNAVAVGTTFFW